MDLRRVVLCPHHLPRRLLYAHHRHVGLGGVCVAPHGLRAKARHRLPTEGADKRRHSTQRARRLEDLVERPLDLGLGVRLAEALADELAETGVAEELALVFNAQEPASLATN